MATIVFEHRGAAAHQNSGKNGAPVTTNAASASITGFVVGDRVIRITNPIAAAINVPEGWYERTGTDSSGNPVYAPTNRS